MKASMSVLALILLAMASSCSSSSTAKGGDAAATNDVGQTSDVSLTRDAASDVAADAVVPPANVSFPQAPDVDCGGDAAACPLPPSACADPSCDSSACPGLQWVVYYDNPMCVNGKCVYTDRFFECSLPTMCTAGGCRYNGTTAAQ